VLVVRPFGLLGKPMPKSRTNLVTSAVWKPLSNNAKLAAIVCAVAMVFLPLVLGDYGIGVAAEVMIAVTFAISLQFLMSVGGLDSFGHAAGLGLGAYGAALSVQYFALPMELALIVGPLLAAVVSAIAGWFCVRLSNIYFAMLTLAFAQIVWSIAFQWVDVTGGDNGIIGVWPSAWASGATAFYWLTLAAAVITIVVFRHLTFSPFGYALRALKDSPMRSASVGQSQQKVQHLAFTISALFAGLAGALLAFQKGSVFPDSLGISTSIDALVMVLLGGFGTVSGSIVGAVVYKTSSIWLMSNTDYPRLILGGLIIILVIAFPEGIVGTGARLWRRFRPAQPVVGAQIQAKGEVA
jgi:branched-chain amino acid transport system permease protein